MSEMMDALIKRSNYDDVTYQRNSTQITQMTPTMRDTAATVQGSTALSEPHCCTGSTTRKDRI